MSENGNGKTEIYEVIFTCTKDKEDHLIGPVRIQSRLRDVAVAKAAIQAFKDGHFKGVTLTSLKVKVRGF
jgi:hypothetical protein